MGIRRVPTQTRYLSLVKEADHRRLVDRIVAVASADDRILIRGFWHDVDHLTTALGRGNTWWAYGQLGELRQMVINLARIEAGAQPDDEAYWKVDETVPEHRLADCGQRSPNRN